MIELIIYVLKPPFGGLQDGSMHLLRVRADPLSRRVAQLATTRWEICCM